MAGTGRTTNQTMEDGGLLHDRFKRYISGQDGYSGQVVANPYSSGTNNTSSTSTSKNTGGGNVAGKTATPGLATYSTGADTQSLLDMLLAQKKPGLDLSNPFGIETSFDKFRSIYGGAQAAAGNLEQQMAFRAADQGAQQNYMAQSQNAGILNNLFNKFGTGAGAKGAGFAAVLQNMMGAQAQQNVGQTALLQGAQNVAGKNAVAQQQAIQMALGDSNKAKEQVGGLATDKYAADANTFAQALIAAGGLAGVMNTNRANIGINNAANKTNASMSNAQNSWNYLTNKG